MDLKRLEHYREYFNKQKGRKYPCSNQIVRCAIVTNDRDKVVDFMSDKEVVKYGVKIKSMSNFKHFSKFDVVEK